MRAAIYARFSSDLQDMRSITDQVAMAQKYADTRSLKQVSVYEDAAISGASILNRPGLQRLLRDAAKDAGQFAQLLLVEATEGGRTVKAIPLDDNFRFRLLLHGTHP